MHRGSSARLGGAALGDAGQPRLLAQLLGLVLRAMRRRQLRLLAVWPLLAVHVRHNACPWRGELTQRLVFRARMVFSRRLLRVRSCASHTAFRLGTNPPPPSRHAASLNVWHPNAL